MPSSINDNQTAQIRLIIPHDWVAELDDLAAARFLTRLGLIRFYLRSQMDYDLDQLEVVLEQREKHQRTHTSLKRYLNDREE